MLPFCTYWRRPRERPAKRAKVELSASTLIFYVFAGEVDGLRNRNSTRAMGESQSDLLSAAKSGGEIDPRIKIDRKIPGG